MSIFDEIFRKKGFKEFLSQVFDDIKKHPIPFVVSFLLSLMLFYYITNIGIQSLLTVGDLEYRLSSDELYLINKQNIKIKIILRGKSQDLKLVNEDLIKPYIKIEATKPGEYLYNVNVDKSYLPNNIKIVKIEPSSAKVTLDKIFRKKVKIEANIKGKCESGYYVSQVSFTKSPYIIVEGPFSILSKLEKVRTSEISVDGLNFPLILPVKLEDKSLKIISPSDLQIIVDIRPLKILKIIKDIPILLSNKSNKFEYIVSQNKFDAKVLISEDLSDKISPSDFIFVIDCSYFQNAGVYTIKIIPKTDLPINIVSTVPEFIKLTVNLIEVGK